MGFLRYLVTKKAVFPPFVILVNRQCAVNVPLQCTCSVVLPLQTQPFTLSALWTFLCCHCDSGVCIYKQASPVRPVSPAAILITDTLLIKTVLFMEISCQEVCKWKKLGTTVLVDWNYEGYSFTSFCILCARLLMQLQGVGWGGDYLFGVSSRKFIFIFPGYRYVILDIPLLFETNRLTRFMKHTVLVYW